MVEVPGLTFFNCVFVFFNVQRLDGSIKGEIRKQALDHFNAEGSEVRSNMRHGCLFLWAEPHCPEMFVLVVMVHQRLTSGLS